MSTNTMSFALPDSMRSHDDQFLRSGQYRNSREHLRELTDEGLSSGDGRILTYHVVAELKEWALGRTR